MSTRWQISYGKLCVPVYRVYATPLKGITPIHESSFTGRDNVVFALEVDVEVFGDNFLPAYTQGDNTNVVATDSMKNFVLKQALIFDGATLEDFLAMLGRYFLETYPQMEQLRLTGRELPFAAATVPDGIAFKLSNVLFSRSHADYAMAMVDFSRVGAEAVISAHRCGRVGLQLLKVTGSAFTRFVRDSYTTLPERSDRPLFVYLDVYWKYTDSFDLVDPSFKHYVAAEQVRDFVQVVFHEFVSESIQHLVHEMGQRLLRRFPQLSEVSFEAQNRTKEPVATSDTDAKVKVYSEPFPAYGTIKLTLTRDI
ncbi:MAG: urate oxidase [Ktedonobacteraceae bacterium]|nr:urate oxidase [Ktedonobacteraceae bacterium]